MSEIFILPLEVEQTIIRFIKGKFEQDNLSVLFQNPLLREEMLDLLDRYCTVVYYPIDDKDNQGFRLKQMPFANGSRQDFVFIDTAQTLEKQVFTAAHELGHIWNVDEFVIQKHKLADTPDMREHIINRFAAILLMPADCFGVSVRAGLKEFGEQGTNSITYVNLLRMIVGMMNQFFAPMKAVVLRLIELDFFRDDVAKILFGYEDIPAEVFTKRIHELCIEYGYTNLLNPNRKRYIEGLAQKLDIAEQLNLVSPNKIRVMREKFDLAPTSAVGPDLDEVISLDTQEGREEKCSSTNTPL